jgi:hypothetical protein
MDNAERKKMRTKQVIATNVILLISITVYFIVFNMFEVTSFQFFALLGIIMLLQAITGLIKGDSTSSFIPVFEQVARYEKQKMGDEWFKQRKMNHIWRFIVSGMMFLQAYWNRNTSDNMIQVDISFLLILALLIFAIINTSQYLHIRKVDRSASHIDMKGYTRKSTLMAIAAGIAISTVFIIVTISYVLI